MAYANVNDALNALDQKMNVLNNLVVANEFLVTSMRDEFESLHVMDGFETRRMLRERARRLFGVDGGETANPAVLEILEKALGNGQTAEIIPFPVQKRTVNV